MKNKINCIKVKKIIFFIIIIHTKLIVSNDPADLTSKIDDLINDNIEAQNYLNKSLHYSSHNNDYAENDNVNRNSEENLRNDNNNYRNKNSNMILKKSDSNYKNDDITNSIKEILNSNENRKDNKLINSSHPVQQEMKNNDLIQSDIDIKNAYYNNKFEIQNTDLKQNNPQFISTLTSDRIKINNVSELKSKNSSPKIKEIDKIKELFIRKIKRINSHNYFSKTLLNNDSTILKHIYVGKNSPLSTKWRYNTEEEKFILPSEISNEDDWNKFLRILSLLDSMDFNLPENEKIVTITNPPIIDLKTGIPNNNIINNSVSIRNIREDENKSEEGQINFIAIKHRKRGAKQDANSTNKDIRNPPNFLIDI